MLHVTKLDQVHVWKIVKKIRLTFLSEHATPDCISTKTILSDTHIPSIINNLGKELKLNITFAKNANVSFTTFETAAEMFTYLNLCPPKIPKYLQFHIHLFESATTTREIVLALTSIMKTLDIANEKEATIKIFKRVMDIFNLTKYRDIQNILKGKCDTNTTGNCTHMLNVNKKGIINMFWFFV